MFRIVARNRAGQTLRRLDRPVRMAIDFDDLDPVDWGNTFVHLHFFDEAAGRWARVPAQTDMENRRIVAEVDHFTDFGFGGDANTLPSTPSNLEGFSVDLCTGYAQAGIGLKVPPGINGLAPAVALRYNSGTIDKMNEHGIADGIGSGSIASFLYRQPLGSRPGNLAVVSGRATICTRPCSSLSGSATISCGPR